MSVRIPVLVLLASACAPTQPAPERRVEKPLPELAGAPAPAGWIQTDYTRGLRLFVPPGTRVARPQGIDSSLLDVRGSGFQLMFDDYGMFGGAGTAKVSGRPATQERVEGVGCRQRIVSVMAGSSNNHLCDKDGRNCTPTAGVIRASGRCVPGAGCDTLDRVIATMRFVSPPYPAFGPIDHQWRPEPPVCRMPTDAS